MLRRLFFLLICCSLLGFAQTKRPFTFEDMMQLKRIGEPIVSPDGKWVAFSAVDVDLETEHQDAASVDCADWRWRFAPPDAR